jgi:hypothetical protein
VLVPLVTISVMCACAMSVAEARQSASSSAQSSSQQSATQQVTVPLTDPSRPVTLKVSLMWGGVTIRGTNRKDVLIEAQQSESRSGRGRVYVDGPGPVIIGGRGARDGGDSTGLRRLPQSGGFSIEENQNEVQVSSGMSRTGYNFVIQVPTRANLRLSAMNDGPIVVENVEGDIEVNNLNDSITLTNIAGSVVANAHNRTLKVVMTRLAADKPMAFTSFNGNVDVTLPQSTNANLKMRSDHGEVFTDFDIQMRPVAPAQAPQGGSGRGFRLDVNQSIQGAINGGGPEFELRTFNGNIYVRKGGS